MSDFKQDVLDLLDRKKGGHVQHWLYTDRMRQTGSGSRLFLDFIQAHGPYYIYRDEITLINRVASTVAADLRSDVVVDFGVNPNATKFKVMPIIKGISNVRVLAGVDVSEKYLKHSARVARENMPLVETRMYRQDFHDAAGRVPLPEGHKLGLLFGSSISNQEMREGAHYPMSQIIGNLDDFRNHLGEEAEMIVTYDANHDGPSVIESYSHPKWSEHVLGIMYDIDRSLKTGGDFDPKNWKHKVVWDDAHYVAHQCAVATKPQSLEIGDRRYRFRAGERFVVVNNMKFPHNIAHEIFEAAGFERKKAYQHNTMVLQHLTT